MSETMALNRYLLFQVGNELYGTPLLDVREVAEYVEPKFMPNMASYFSGVINIRGSIVGVADLRKRFGQTTQVTRNTALLVCDTTQGPIAVVVDQVDSVITIQDTDLERSPPVMTAVPVEYLTGIAKVEGQLVTIVQLQKLLNEASMAKQSA